MEGERYRYTVLIWPVIIIISVAISLLGCGDDEKEVTYEDYSVIAIVRERIDNEEYINLPGVMVQFTANKLRRGSGNLLETLSAVKITDDDGMCDWSFGFDMTHADIEGDVIEFEERVEVTVYASKDGISDTETIKEMWDIPETVLLYLDPRGGW